MSAHEESPPRVSYSFIRDHIKQFNKFEVLEKLVGKMFATQQLRPIGKLHSHFSGVRTELDYSRFGRFLFPNENWNEPLFYYTGFGMDDHSGVVKGYVTSLAPSTRETVRLYRRCVLPKSMWLPARLRHLGAEWDAFGYEVIVAIDNAPDFTSHGASLMFLVNGTIILRMPVKRGDLKGSIERLIRTVEDQHVSTQSGYVARAYVGFDDRYSQVRKRAMLAADETVAQSEDKMAQYLVEQCNAAPHPQFRTPRIQVFRESQERYPLLLPCGMNHIRTTFALTYSVKLTREGVEVEGFKYNSTELFEAFVRFNGNVIVKLDPDDIRAVLVLLPVAVEPIEAALTTLDITFPCSLELAKAVLARVAARHPADDSWMLDINHEFLMELDRLQTKPVEPTPGKKTAHDATAAAHASNAPSAPPAPKPPSPKLSDLLRGSELGDDDE
jgi:hypothetical protein